jgi:hypothetical protein
MAIQTNYKEVIAYGFQYLSKIKLKLKLMTMVKHSNFMEVLSH